MHKNTAPQAQPFNPWHFIWISVVISEIFTALISVIQHSFAPEQDIRYILKVGAIDSLFVPLIVIPIVIYFLRNASVLKKINSQLEYEIAERKRTEEGLRESEEKFALFMDYFPAIVFIKDVEGRLLFVNKHMKEHLGAHDWIGKTKLELLPRAISESMTAEDKKALSAGYLMSVVTLPHVDGTDHIYQTRKFAITRTGKASLLGGLAIDITESKRAEGLLQESEERLRLAMAANRQGWYDLNLQTGEVSVSEEYQRILGYEPAEFHSSLQEWTDGLHPEDRGPALMVLQEAIATGESRTMEYRRRKKTGEWMWVRSTGKVVEYDADKRPLRMIGTHTDISEQKRSEEKLKESENLLHAVVESSGDAIFVKDLHGRYLLINKAGASLVGKPPEEILGKDDTSLFQPAEAVKVMADDKNVASFASSVIFEHVLTMANGQRIVQVRKGPIIDAHGNVMGIYGISRDISENKKVENDLRSSETRFRAIIDNASDGIILADAETKGLRYSNPKICNLLGYNAQELRDLRLPDLLVQEEVLSTITGFQTVADGKIQNSERLLKRKDGSLVRMNINSLRMELDGRPCLVGFFTDITERHLLEEERLKTHKLEALGTLAGGIAHDFNNLLQGVFGYISLARLNRDDREKSQSALEEAEKALHMTVKLTNQLLTFSKGGKPVKKTIDLPPVIENAVKFALSGSRSDYRIVSDDGLWQVAADEGQIGQVVQNMVLNADQSMPEGGRVEIAAKNMYIESTMTQGLQKGTYVKIAIKDDGVGIPEQYLAKIFDPYFTTKEKGSGLGLATSYSIIKNHNGSIAVQSERGKGTTFTIYIPAIAIRSEAPGVPAAAATVGRAGRVLVMDDEQVIRDVAGALLKSLGQSVEFASQGKEAVEKYQEAQRAGLPFDIVILDLTVRGGMGGVETLRRLTEIDPSIKAVVSSGYSDDAVIAGYREQGFKAILKKPYSIDELRNVLNSLLNS